MPSLLLIIVTLIGFSIAFENLLLQILSSDYNDITPLVQCTTQQTICDDILPDYICERFLSPEPKLGRVTCNETSFEPIVLQCLHTCKMCCNDPKYNCEDGEGTQQCKVLSAAKYCTEDTDYKQFMLRECANTCGSCDYRGEGNCTDATEFDCRQLSTLCNKTDGLGKLVKEKCQWTCGNCP